MCVCVYIYVHMYISAYKSEASPQAFGFRAGAHMHFRKHHPSHHVEALLDFSTEALTQMVRLHCVYVIYIYIYIYIDIHICMYL